jgi:hypothetical protein
LRLAYPPFFYRSKLKTDQIILVWSCLVFFFYRLDQVR